MWAVGASAQNFQAIMAATAEAQRDATALVSDMFGRVSQSMRSLEAQSDKETAAELADIAVAMRSLPLLDQTTARTAGSYGADAYGHDAIYNYGPTYSTYGLDPRQEMESQNPMDIDINPFLMGTYDPETTFAAPAGSSFSNNGKRYKHRPVMGAATSGYGYRPRFGRMHYGVDLSLNTGEPVKAAFPGKVVQIGFDPKGYGKFVKIKHEGNLETLYAHLESASVKFGQQVKAGEVIGKGGATGNATGPHLHFETRLSGTAVDPRAYFDFGGKADSRPLRYDTANGGNKKAGSGKESKADGDSKQKAVKSKAVATTTISTAAPRSKAAESTKPRKANGPATYRVGRGETLASIARDNGLSLSELCRINKCSPYTPIYKGKVLKLR